MKVDLDPHDHSARVRRDSLPAWKESRIVLSNGKKMIVVVLKDRDLYMLVVNGQAKDFARFVGEEFGDGVKEAIYGYLLELWYVVNEQTKE